MLHIALYYLLLAVEVGLKFPGSRLAVFDNLLPSADYRLDVIQCRCCLLVPQGDNSGQSSRGNQRRYKGRKQC